MTATVKRTNPDAVKKAAEALQKARLKEIAVGFPAGSSMAYPDGTRVLDVAASHVFGVGVPKRDFMELAKGGIIETTRPILKAMARANDEKTLTALQNAAGQAAQAEIQQAIIDLDDPPNSPTTIAKKGSSNPLIDTGLMKDSVTYVIRDKGSR